MKQIMVKEFDWNQSQENQMLSKRVSDEKVNNNEMKTIDNNINNGINNGINGYQTIIYNNNKRMKMTSNNENTSQTSDDGYHDTHNDNIDDLLNDEDVDNVCSQVYDNVFAKQLNETNINTKFNNKYNRVNYDSDPITIDVQKVITRSDVMFNQQLVDSTQGKNKLLEMRVQSLEDELRRTKAQMIQNNKQKQELTEEHKRVIEHQEQNYRTLSNIRDNESKTYQRTIDDLTELYSNTKGHNIKVELANDYFQKKKNCPNFSQSMLEEFHAPLVPTFSITSLSPNSILVPETQIPNHNLKSQMFTQMNGIFKHPSIIKSNKVPFSCSTQIGSTQSKVITNNANVSQISSQNDSQLNSQSQNMKWEPIKAQIVDQFRANRQSLSNCLIYQQLIGIFADDWLRNKADVIDWSQNLTKEMTDYKITSIVKFEHLNEYINK